MGETCSECIRGRDGRQSDSISCLAALRGYPGLLEEREKSADPGRQKGQVHVRKTLFANILIAAGAVLAIELLLAVRDSRSRVALGQAVGVPAAPAILAAIQGQSNEPWVFVYDVENKQLSCYTVKNGIEFRGARNCTHDLKVPDIQGISNKRLTPDDVRKLLSR
jgi:hypothetical protein